MKKLLAILLTVCTIVGAVAMMPISASEPIGEIEPDISWYTASATEYVITTEAQFLGIPYVYSMAEGASGETFEGKTIKLGDNLVLNSGNAADWATTAPANQLYQLSTANNPFKGTFDGQGYSISGVYMKGSADMGMFNRITGVVDSEGKTVGGIIKDVAILNSYVEGTDRVGTLVGRIAGGSGATIENVYVESVVKATGEHVGGFIGTVLSYATKTSFINCTFAGSITGADGKRGVGGILGGDTGAQDGAADTGRAVPQVSFSNCINLGTIKGGKLVGGIVGFAWSMTADKCVNLGTVEAINESGGGIAGDLNYNSKVTNSYVATDGLVGTKNAAPSEKTGSAIVGQFNGSKQTEAVNAPVTGENCNVILATRAEANGDAAKTKMPALD